MAPIIARAKSHVSRKTASVFVGDFLQSGWPLLFCPLLFLPCPQSGCPNLGEVGVQILGEVGVRIWVFSRNRIWVLGVVVVVVVVG